MALAGVLRKRRDGQKVTKEERPTVATYPGMASEEAEEEREYSAREWAGPEDASCTTQAQGEGYAFGVDSGRVLSCHHGQRAGRK